MTGRKVRATAETVRISFQFSVFSFQFWVAGCECGLWVRVLTRK
jgi:hypothetical protein